MSRPKYVVAHCGHTTTEKYLDTQPLGCCAKCAKNHDVEQTRAKLEEIRRSLAVPCKDCGKDVEPLEDAEVLLGVYWGTLEIDQAKLLTLRAHNRHEHTSYDKARRELESKGFSGKEARSLVRYGEI
jgi:hypothetical protein